MARTFSRRSFIKNISVGGAVIASSIPLLAVKNNNTQHLCILHTNDTHSRIDPYPDNDPNYPNMGGYARRSALISSVRQSNEHVLLLDSGDIFQGTPYFNLYGGEPELKLMSQMQYDASTIGNHEFDNGLEHLAKILRHASFPFISSNYDFTGTPMEGKTLTHKVIQKGNVKVGLYGLGIALQGLVGTNLYGNTKYHDPLQTAMKMEHFLKEEKKCDLIICLSHLGYRYRNEDVSDVVIAQNTRFTNIILGGHTHTLLENHAEILNAAEKKVYIGQTGYGGVRLGRIDLYFNEKNNETLVESNTIKILENQVV
jgi:5'-nucleotidase